ncbi:MAG TPA: lysophospholipid acyltransferase family protein [Bacteroidales bacterium]|nr:lysophospholipid acyltransferase family protein [Bacteroidales bacterium]
MILKASHNWFIYGFFRLYTNLSIRRSFHRVVISGEIADNGLPVLVLSNHTSWWDGFWIVYMNMKLFKRRFFFMMLESQLRKKMFFNHTGGYSVLQGSRSILESIEYTIELLNDKENMVLLFPQGRIESIHNRNISFAKGIARISERLKGKVQVVFAVCLPDYFSERKPSVYIYLGEYDYSVQCAKAFHDFYNNSLKIHSEKTSV